MNAERCTYESARLVHLRLTLGPLHHGRGDPTSRFAADGAWRATRTPDGPATLRLRADGGDPTGCAHRVDAWAWGPGATWALQRVPDLLGEADDDDVATDHPLVSRLRRRLRGLRMSRSQAVAEALVPTVLAQKVQGDEAARSYHRLARLHGDRAPGPADLLLPPSPHRLAEAGYCDLHPLGVERRRAETVRAVARSADRLDRLAQLPSADAQRRMQAVPGVGPWTAGRVALGVLGDADAVVRGDYHFPHQVAHALAGRPRGDDDLMVRLLEPFRGQRGRVLRLVVLAGPQPPRYGPRLAPRTRWAW